jgi:hypothetical protein
VLSLILENKRSEKKQFSVCHIGVKERKNSLQWQWQARRKERNVSAMEMASQLFDEIVLLFFI